MTDPTYTARPRYIVVGPDGAQVAGPFGSATLAQYECNRRGGLLHRPQLVAADPAADAITVAGDALVDSGAMPAAQFDRRRRETWGIDVDLMYEDDCARRCGF